MTEQDPEIARLVERDDVPQLPDEAFDGIFSAVRARIALRRRRILISALCGAAAALVAMVLGYEGSGTGLRPPSIETPIPLSATPVERARLLSGRGLDAEAVKLLINLDDAEAHAVLDEIRSHWRRSVPGRSDG